MENPTYDMLLHSSHLDAQRLSRLLESRLPAREESAAAEHLETCEVCLRELETLAADRSWWTDASRLLNDTVEPPRLTPEEISHEDLRQFLEPSDSPAMLGRVGEYDIVEVLGRGGFGIVLKGYDRELNRFVAIKVLAPHFAGIGAARQRFAREAQAAAAVVHPNVISIHAVDGQSRLPYLVMPLVVGESLQQRLDREGPLPLEVILRIARQVADGLSAAHAQGLVHRDVKPANILLEKGVDRVVLTDFGLARAADDATLTCSGIVAGTPQYMSPEQARGDGIDARSDLFSLGSVIYAMAAGVPPFRAASPIAVLRRICDDQPRPASTVNPRVPAWIDRIIGRLHAKSPDSRLAEAGDLSRLLEQCLAHVQNPAVLPLPKALRPSARRRLWLSVAAVGLIVASTTAIVVQMRPESVRQTPAGPVGTAPEAESVPGDLRWAPSAEIRQLTADVDALEKSVAEAELEEPPQPARPRGAK